MYGKRLNETMRRYSSSFFLPKGGVEPIRQTVEDCCRPPPPTAFKLRSFKDGNDGPSQDALLPFQKFAICCRPPPPTAVPELRYSFKHGMILIHRNEIKRQLTASFLAHHMQALRISQ